MNVFVQVGAWITLVAATGSMALAWSDPRPDLTHDDARAVAVGALTSVGYEAEPSGEVVAATRRLDDGRDIGVLVVEVLVGTDPITIEVQDDVGAVVRLDDRVGPDRAQYLLQPEEYAEFGTYRNDRAVDRQVVRNVFVTIASIFSAVMAVALIAFSGRILRADELGSGTAVPADTVRRPHADAEAVDADTT